VPVSNFGPDKDLVVFDEYGFLCDESKQDHIGSGLHRIYGSDAVDKKNVTSRELTGGVLSQPAILEYSTKGMISKHEESSLVRITLAYKVPALKPPFFKPICIYTQKGNRNDSLEW
jgi:hypothetical protein